MIVTTLTLAAVLGAGPPLDAATLHDRTTDALGLHTAAIESLDVPANTRLATTVAVPIDGTACLIDLVPNSVRAKGFTMYAVGADGVPRVTDPGIERTYEGTVRGFPDSIVAASVLDEGLQATLLFANGQRYWIEPIASRVDGALPGQHAIYANSDVHVQEWHCGMDTHVRDRHDDRAPLGPPESGVTPQIAHIAVEADYPYFASYDDIRDVGSQMAAVINSANVQYVSQVGIRHVISGMVIRFAPAADPYTTTDAADLVCQFSREWWLNWGFIPRDVAHLFTGRDLNGGTIGRAAEIGSICETVACPTFPCTCDPDWDTRGSYCIAQSDFNGDYACATDLTAHELGHLWDAVHCTPCSTTMNSFITCANTFGLASIFDIVAYRNTRPCLNSIPNNNQCGDALVLYEGTTSFSNVNATTDGPNHAGCENAGDDQIGSDVWYLHAADCTGTLTVSTCGTADYDTKIAVYKEADFIGFSCPGGWPMTLVGCNDDGTGCAGFSSFLQVPVDAFTEYRIRIGGYNAQQGSGTINVSCDLPNDYCSNPMSIGNGATSFSTVGANTDGVEHITCGFCCNDPQIHADIWYLYTATCDGALTVSTCDASTNYDTKLAVYRNAADIGWICQFGGPPQALLGCDDDAGCGLTSEVTVAVQAGNQYRIRVGGYNGADGNGVINLSCTPVDCPSDATGDGVVDTDDLLGVLANWGTDNAQFDIAPVGGDGIVDVQDLLAVIGDWGVCR